MTIIEYAQAIKYSNAAFQEEYLGNLDNAYQLHEAAISSLTLIAQDHNDKATRKTAKQRIEIHNSRLAILRRISESPGKPLFITLPTALSAEESLNRLQDSGETALGLEEPLFCKYLLDLFENSDVTPPSQIQHLLQSPVPAFAPALNPNLSSTKYNITVEADAPTLNYRLKAAPVDHPDQIFYTLNASRWAKQQLNSATFFRSTEFSEACIDINIAPIKLSANNQMNAPEGRSLEYIPSNSLRSIVEVPDQPENRVWGPQRFSYAGRQFAWINEGQNELQLPSLYETETAWPEAGPGISNYMKEIKSLGPKLCWGTFKSCADVPATVDIAGGVDQVFSELLLASQMTKLAIFMFGHDG